MPPIFAAPARSIPSRTAASDKRRRLWFASFDRRARARSSPAEYSSRNLTADGMARISRAKGVRNLASWESPMSQSEGPLVLRPCAGFGFAALRLHALSMFGRDIGVVVRHVHLMRDG